METNSTTLYPLRSSNTTTDKGVYTHNSPPAGVGQGDVGEAIVRQLGGRSVARVMVSNPWHTSPRIPSNPSFAMMGAMTSAATGSAHHKPNAAISTLCHPGCPCLNYAFPMKFSGASQMVGSGSLRLPANLKISAAAMIDPNSSTVKTPIATLPA